MRSPPRDWLRRPTGASPRASGAPASKTWSPTWIGLSRSSRVSRLKSSVRRRSNEAPPAHAGAVSMTLHPWLRRPVPFVLCLVAAIVATWPLLPSIASALPLGTEHEATVPLFNLWTLWWDADRVPHGFRGLWNAPIFHPLEGTFTFSEPMLLLGVTLSPLWWL